MEPPKNRLCGSNASPIHSILNIVAYRWRAVYKYYSFIIRGIFIEKLVVAEKPSVAMSYAKILGATSRKDGYLEGNGYLVSWCVGHLVELAPPNVYDEKYVKWSVADLPILPEKWQYLVSASTKKQFGILKKLMHRPDVESVICATDAG